jgi:hypothetical protein
VLVCWFVCWRGWDTGSDKPLGGLQAGSVVITSMAEVQPDLTIDSTIHAPLPACPAALFRLCAAASRLFVFTTTSFCCLPPCPLPPCSRQRGLQPVHLRHAPPGLRLLRAPGLCERRDGRRLLAHGARICGRLVRPLR